jgi:solute:Na+ symporter, SSS family
MMLGPLDAAVLVLYFLASLALGFWFGRGERSTNDFFLGGRTQHWLLAGMSILATEVSAATVILVPADSFRGDWNYLQMYFGAFAGRILILYLLLPAFYGGSVTTVYEYLGQRFGRCTRTTASIMFLASRLIGSGIRLLAASLALSVVFDWPLPWVVFAAAGVAIAYTTFGGIKAILWTDALQACIFIIGPIALVLFIYITTPTAWAEELPAALDAGKMHIFTWDKNPNNDKAFWVLVIHALLLNMAAFGTDQDMTQRMLTCPDLKRSRRSLLFNAIIGFPVVCLFLFVGTSLFVHYASPTAAPLPQATQELTDRIFPHFIATALPTNVGIKGLLIAAIFAAAMSSLSSALGAISSTVVTDLYRPLRTRMDDAHYLMVARLCTFGAGLILAGIALAFARYDELLWETFRAVSVVFGSMLGVFLLGVTTRRRGHDFINMIAMTLSAVGLFCLKYVQESRDVVYIAWPWWVVMGTAFTYFAGVCTQSRRKTSVMPTRRP